MRHYVIIILIFINLTVFAQHRNYAKFNKRVGIKTYVDFLLGFQTDVAYLDKNPANLLGGYFSSLFNNKYYTGFYYEQKIGVTSANTTFNNDKYYGGDLKFQSGGVFFGFYKVFQKKRTRSDFIKKLTRLNISLKTGLGRDWVLDKKTQKPLNNKDYLVIITPSIGVERPISHFVAVGIGLNYHIIRRSDFYFSNNEISGYGAYFTVRLSIFNNPLIQGKPPGF